MAIPSFNQFLRPVLELISELEKVEAPRVALVPLIKEKMNFGDQDAAEKLDSGGNRLENRIGWALTYLKKSTLIDFPSRGIATITPKGRDFLSTHKGPISPKDLEIFPEYLEFKKGNEKNNGETVSDTSTIEEVDPEEKINIGYREIKNSIVSEIKEKLFQMTPLQFEKTVLDLIRALGYGGVEDKIEHTGGSGDFGIDGVVYLDRLGLDKIYLQAKRYKEDSKINSRQIQEFFGALKGRGAAKGIFLTTSSYQPSAIEYAKMVSDTMILIDGSRIAELMIESGVGVSVKKKIVIPAIDNDYFES